MHPYIHARKQPDKPAFVMADSGATLTYAQLENRSNQVAQLLRSSGLVTGDHIAILLENHPRYFEICFGAHRAGIIYTAMSSRLTVGEAAYIIANSEAKLLITSRAMSALAKELLTQTPGLKQRLMIDGTAPGYAAYESALAPQPASRIADESAGGDMLYSSGTTGRPKGVWVAPESAAIDAANPLLNICINLWGVDADSIYQIGRAHV